MKQVLDRKWNISWKDLIRYCAILIGHYMLMLIFAIVVFTIKLDLTNHIFGITNPVFETMILYSVIFGPIVNTLFHAWFTERGKPWIRLIMWMHTITCFVLISLGGLL